MTNVVQCSLMQNNESDRGEKKIKERKHLTICKLKHTQNNREKKKKKKSKLNCRHVLSKKNSLQCSSFKIKLEWGNRLKVVLTIKENMEKERMVITRQLKILIFENLF